MLLLFALVTGNGVISPRLDFVFPISKSVATGVIIVLRGRPRLNDDHSRNLELNLGVSRHHREGGGEAIAATATYMIFMVIGVHFVEFDRGWQRRRVMTSVGNYLFRNFTCD